MFFKKIADNDVLHLSKWCWRQCFHHWPCQEVWQKLLKINENDLNWWLTSWGLTRLSSSGSWTRLLERYKRTQTYNRIRNVNMIWCDVLGKSCGQICHKRIPSRVHCWKFRGPKQISCMKQTSTEQSSVMIPPPRRTGPMDSFVVSQLKE